MQARWRTALASCAERAARALLLLSLRRQGLLYRAPRLRGAAKARGAALGRGGSAWQEPRRTADVLCRTHAACNGYSTRGAAATGDGRARRRPGAQPSCVCTKQSRQRATPPARLAPPHAARAARAARRFSGSAQASGVASAPRRSPASSRPTLGFGNAAGRRAAPRAPAAHAPSRSRCPWRTRGSTGGTCPARTCESGPSGWSKHGCVIGRGGASAPARGTAQRAQRKPGVSATLPAAAPRAARVGAPQNGGEGRRTSCGHPWRGHCCGCSRRQRTPWLRAVEDKPPSRSG